MLRIHSFNLASPCLILDIVYMLTKGIPFYPHAFYCHQAAMGENPMMPNSEGTTIYLVFLYCITAPSWWIPHLLLSIWLYLISNKSRVFVQVTTSSFRLIRCSSFDNIVSLSIHRPVAYMRKFCQSLDPSSILSILSVHVIKFCDTFIINQLSFYPFFSWNRHNIKLVVLDIIHHCLWYNFASCVSLSLILPFGTFHFSFFSVLP